MVRTRFTGSGREREGGYLGLHKQDFVAHYTGGDWRHFAEHIDMDPELPSPLNGSNVQITLENIGTNLIGHGAGTHLRHTADHIDMNPPVPLFPAPTVQETLELISASGQGFITIGGDNYSVGSPKLDLYDAFTWAFNQLRIANKGGIVVVQSGDYVLRRTVEVPKGITIWGEPGGARIVSEVTTGPAFTFEFSTDRDDIGNGTSSDVSTKMSRMWNLALFDNKDGTVASGGPSTPGSPLILMDEGCELLLENVTLIGRNNGTAVTEYAISVAAPTGSTPADTPTILHMNNCFIDAVATVVYFTPVLRPDISDLKIDKCRARTYSYSANKFFAISTIGKISISNNYHIGITPTGYTDPSGFLRITTPNTSVSTSFISLIGNKGGLNIIDDSSLNNELSRQRWFVDGRSLQWSFKYSDIGNSWGAVNSTPWYIIVGDGIHSMGDLTGSNALDIISALENLDENNLNSRNEQVIIINPGQYVTSTKLNISKLIGNPVASSTVGSNRIIRISLNSDEEIFSTGVYDNFVGKAENVEFFANGNPQRIASILEDPQDSIIYKNVRFVNCSVYIENNRTAIVEDCYFNQDGTYDDIVSLVITTDESSYVNRCKFTGYGYALSQSSWEGEVYLTNSWFNQQNELNVIRNIDPLYSQDKYITVGRFSSVVHVNNVLVNGGQYAISSAMRPIYTTHVDINSSNTLNVTNSIFYGPDQIHNNQSPIIACSIKSEQSLNLNGNYIVGALPLSVSDFSQSSPINMGSRIQISNNEIRHYLNTVNNVVTALSLDLAIAGGLKYPNCDGYEGYDGYDGYLSLPIAIDFEGHIPFSSVNISNNRIIGFSKENPLAVTNIWSHTYTDIGLLQLFAPGWSVKLDSNNIVYINDDTELPIGKLKQSAVYANNAGGNFTYSNISVNNNTISHKNPGCIGQNLSLLNIKTDIANISGNTLLSWYCNCDLDVQDGYNRSFIDINPNRPGSIISGNSFNSSNIAGITKPINIGISDGYGIISGNWFDVSSYNNILYGNNSGWILSSENYGRFDFQ